MIGLASGGIVGLLPPRARGQQSSRKVWRLAFLNTDSWESEVQRALFEVFRHELRLLGYEEGRNLVIERRTAESQIGRLDQLTQELMASKPDAMVAVATPAIAAAQRATETTPIIMWGVTDPVDLGFIASLSHPGGNLTGVATMFSETAGKTLEVLHAILPQATRVALLGPSNPSRRSQIEKAQAAAKQLGLVPIPIYVAGPTDFDAAFEKMEQEKCEGVFVLAAPIEPKLVSLAAVHNLPAVYQFSAYVDLGGLASYGANLAQMGKQTAQYTAKIFQGAKAAELPVEQPVAFELALNLKTASALGLVIPASVLTRADRVIE